MWYIGSKNRLSKYLVPIIESYIDEKTEDKSEDKTDEISIDDDPIEEISENRFIDILSNYKY